LTNKTQTNLIEIILHLKKTIFTGGSLAPNQDENVAV